MPYIIWLWVNELILTFSHPSVSPECITPTKVCAGSYNSVQPLYGALVCCVIFCRNMFSHALLFFNKLVEVSCGSFVENLLGLPVVDLYDHSFN